jgi:chemotaxis response regulator CheB
MPIHRAEDGMLLRPRNVYIGPPDHHLLALAGRLHLANGPRENCARPAIDPLFRSAAVSKREVTAAIDEAAKATMGRQRPHVSPPAA